MPAEAVAAQREGFASDSLLEKAVKAPIKRPLKSSWASWRPASDSEDFEQLSGIGRTVQEATGSDSPAHGRAGQISGRSSQPPPPSYLVSTARGNTLKEHAQDARASQAQSRFWQCDCGLRNMAIETACMRCHTPAPETATAKKAGNTDDPSIAQGWKHVRHVGEANSTGSTRNTQAQEPQEYIDRSQDQARFERFEESKGSRFVGFESKFKKPKFGEVEDVLRIQSRRNGQYTFSRSADETWNRSRTSNAEGLAPTAQAETQERPQQAVQGRGWRRSSPSTSEPPDSSQKPPPPTRAPSVERTKTWARWTAQEKKADPEIFATPQEQVPPTRGLPLKDSKPEERFSNGWREWTAPEPDAVDQGHGPPPRDMSANEMRAQNRMARRLQELEEQASKSTRNKPTAPRFDERRESRGSMRQTRKLIEERGKYDLDDLDEDGSRKRQERKELKKRKQAAQKSQGPPTPIYLPEFISVANLAGVLRIKIEDFTTKMMKLGFEEINNDHILDAETAGLIASEFNYEPIVDEPEVSDLVAQPPTEDKSLLPQRPPVVTIMGHVDHGKTTLLDWLRKSSVAATEHGGITQHIGAFSVSMPSGRVITFLDTPGHAAFLDMRQRGANVTDIVILVVAADDSVKPQTIEAIKHAQAAQVPMIVAVNKIDKEDANVDKVKQDLARYGVEIEDYGGDTQVVCVSGKTGQGMETLEESAVALADILDIRAANEGPAEGWVLEATTKKAGRVATVLVRRGTLRPSDIIVAGTTWARVRTLRNEAGAVVDSAGPGTPVEVDGWKDQPSAGDEVLQATSEQHARSVISIRLEAAERVQLASDTTAVNESRRLEQERREAAEAAAQAGEGATTVTRKPNDARESFKEVPLLVKADVSGSVEAVLASVLTLGNTSVRPSILRSGVGAVSEFDISHAASAQAHIICFNVGMEQHIRRMAESQGVRIVEQNIIYRLVDAVKGVLEEYLEPIRTKRVLGEAEIAQVFDINVRGRIMVPIAGCRVRNGVIGRNAKVMVRRGEEVVFDGIFLLPASIATALVHWEETEILIYILGSLSSLKNRKQDATEMRKGMECGIGFEGWKEFQVGDLVQSYEEKVEKRTL